MEGNWEWWKDLPGLRRRNSPSIVEEFSPSGWQGTRCIVGKYAAQAKFCIQLLINLFLEVNKIIQPNVNGGRIYPHSGLLRIAMVEVSPPSRRLSGPFSDVQADHRTWFITICLARRRHPRPWLFAPSWKKFPPPSEAKRCMVEEIPPHQSESVLMVEEFPPNASLSVPLWWKNFPWQDTVYQINGGGIYPLGRTAV